MKKFILSALLVLSVLAGHAQVNTDKVIIHIGGHVFTLSGDIELSNLGNSQKIIEGDSTVTKYPNVTIVTNSKTHTKEIYINGGAEDFSYNPGSIYMNFGGQMDSMFNNKFSRGDNMPNLSFNWSNGNFPGNMDSMITINKKWMDSMVHRNNYQMMPQQYYYQWNNNGNNDENKEELKEKIENLNEQLNNLQNQLNKINEQSKIQGKENSNVPTQQDTTRVRVGNFSIIINHNGVKIGHPDTSLHSSNNEAGSGGCKQNFTTHWLLLDIGFNTYLNNLSTNLPSGYSPLELIQGKSVNVNLELFQQRINLAKQYLFFSYGVAFDFYNYRFRQNTSLVPKIDSVKFVEAPADLSKNKLSDTYITIPVMVQYESSTNYAKSFHLGLGLNAGYLITAHTKQVSAEYGKVKIWDDYNLSSFSYGPTLRLGFSWFNLYANYGINGLFKTGSAPTLNPFSFGISIIAD